MHRLYSRQKSAHQVFLRWMGNQGSQQLKKEANLQVTESQGQPLPKEADLLVKQGQGHGAGQGHIQDQEEKGMIKLW